MSYSEFIKLGMKRNLIVRLLTLLFRVMIVVPFLTTFYIIILIIYQFESIWKNKKR